MSKVYHITFLHILCSVEMLTKRSDTSLISLIAISRTLFWNIEYQLAYWSSFIPNSLFKFSISIYMDL